MNVVCRKGNRQGIHRCHYGYLCRGADTADNSPDQNYRRQLFPFMVNLYLLICRKYGLNSYEMITVAEKLIQFLQPAMTSQDIQLSMTNLKGSIIASTRKDNVGKFCEPDRRSFF